MEKKKSPKRDLLLVAVILVIAAAGFGINYLRHQGPAEVVEISVDGHVTGTYPLNKNLDIIVNGYNNGTNHLIVEDGQAWIADASCPDKICIHQGKISRDGEMIVCLPNMMIAQIVSAED